MLKYLLRRAFQSLVALCILVVLLFLMTRLTGNPTDLYLPLSATAEMREAFAEQQGYNDPLHIQFMRFVRDLARGDFGESLYQARPALTIALEAFPTTLALAAIALPLAMALALLFGSLAALRPNGLADRLISSLTILSSSAPPFWVAIVAIVVFSIGFRWLPTSGTTTPWHWIMPVGVLVLGPLGSQTLVVRSSMVGALKSNYVKTSRSKGAARPRVIFVHALRNALLPVITVAGADAASLIGGSVVVETIFGFPGIGNLMIDSIRNRDFSVTIACLMLAAVVLYTVNLLIDILYTYLDPRISLSR